jgi:L-serine dehydratase
MTANECLSRCSEQACTLGVLSIRMEQERHPEEKSVIFSRLEEMLRVMEAEAENALYTPVYSVSGLTGGDGCKYERYRAEGRSLLGEIPALATAYALSASETNAAMGRIVACPTAGSCGIVPACVLAVGRARGIDREKVLEALAAAGLVGELIDEHASLSGAQGGCQAECGSAAAMAAAAVVEMLGGTPAMAFHAGAIAIKNMLGLVCDPVAGLVEIPCIKRNVGGVSIALSAADLALAGVESRIPFDDTVDAMNRVGKSIPTALRETALGGLAATETGKAMQKQVFGE